MTSNFPPLLIQDYINIQRLKAFPQFKILISIIIIVFGLYFFLGYLNDKPEAVKPKYYAKKISLKEYEIQKRSYTQMKLSELYDSSEYQEHVRRKMMQNQNSFQEVEFSDEDS